MDLIDLYLTIDNYFLKQVFKVSEILWSVYSFAVLSNR